MENPQMVSWVMVVGGAVLALLGVYKLITKGLALFIWGLLIILGLFGVNYGLQQDAIELSQENFPSTWLPKLREFIEPGKQISTESMTRFCESFIEKNGVQEKQQSSEKEGQ